VKPSSHRYRRTAFVRRERGRDRARWCGKGGMAAIVSRNPGRLRGKSRGDAGQGLVDDGSHIAGEAGADVVTHVNKGAPSGWKGLVGAEAAEL
jgi:hypothetical protein